MADDFIRLKPFGESNETGFKLTASIIIDLGFSKGIDTSDLSLPSSTKRKLLPTSGLKEDYSVTIELIDDGFNKAYSIDNIGNETALDKVTTGEQLNFLIDSMVSANLGAVYEIYIDWLGRSFVGLLTFRGQARGTDFFNKVGVVATLKVGENILGL